MSDRETEIRWVETICQAHLERAIAEERTPTFGAMVASILHEIDEGLKADLDADTFCLSEAEVEKICMSVMEDPIIKERNAQVEW